jgi:hypothetical protein
MVSFFRLIPVSGLDVESAILNEPDTQFGE